MILEDKNPFMTKLLYLILVFIFFISCNSNRQTLVKIEGNAQGTTYHITYLSYNGINHKTTIDSLLRAIDNSMSTWVPTSVISRVNDNDSTVTVDDYFIEVFTKSVEVSQKTDGFFDVTVGPLVNSYGFAATKKEKPDRRKVDSLLQFVGYQMLKLEGNKIVKARPEIKLDFNALAQGYSVDVLARYLEGKGVDDYLIELGGEVKAKGKKGEDYWKVGIDKPDEKVTGTRSIEAVIHLNNKALATSGNYRKFYEEDGKRYSHIIDPRTGYSAKQQLLSATVIANDGVTADAYATAFMAMGLKKSVAFLEAHPALGLEVYFIYDDGGRWKTYSSQSLKKWIEELR
jgi:FAD:protein FMN transferase